MTNHPSLLFNGKSMRNAIIKRLAEDHNLTSAMFSNSNITIMVDIISYMYQSLMDNLQFAASESMFTDTMLFENASRLAKKIGYYAKGAYPFSLIARLDSDNDLIGDQFYSTTLTHGPHSFNFALVNDTFTNTSIPEAEQYTKLVLGEWNYKTFEANGDKFEEFEIPKLTDNKYISQQYVVVNVIDSDTNVTHWTYSDTPLFATILRQSDTSNPQQRLVSNSNPTEWYKFNFVLDENGSYILKFGDGITSAKPGKTDTILVAYISSSHTAASVTNADVTAINSAEASNVKFATVNQQIQTILHNTPQPEPTATVLPVTDLGGFKAVDTVASIKANAAQAFSRQQRVVTKSDYKSYLLENDSGAVDCLVQNNWDFISTYYGYIFNLGKLHQTTETDTTEAGLALIEQAAKRGFNTTLDAADANNIYLWTLMKTSLAINDGLYDDIATATPERLMKKHITKGASLFDSVKNVTEQVVQLHPIWRTYCPYVSKPTNSNDSKYIALTDIASAEDTDDLLEATNTKINIYTDLSYSNNTARIKATVNKLIKQYLYDDILLGVTPNVNQLLKEILTVPGITSVTTVYDYADEDSDVRQVREVNGLQFLVWTATPITDNVVGFDATSVNGLPQINQFEYLKCAIGYNDFISKFVSILPDYTRNV